MSPQPVAFPEAKRFSDLFVRATAHKAPDAPAPVPWTFTDNWGRRPVQRTIDIGPYCSMRTPEGFDALSVEPTQAVVDFIKVAMLPTAHDTIGFEIVFRDDGTALVLARNNQIIASRWLAYIDAATVPRFKEE